MAAAERTWWVAGWCTGALVVVTAAGLLVAMTVLARRLGHQARDIDEAIRGTRDHTTALLDLPAINAALARTAAAGAARQDVAR